MKYILMLVFSVFLSVLNANSINVHKHKVHKVHKVLNESQQELAKEIYSKTKEFNLGYTLVAIAWQESQLGKYKINLSDPSCGVFHIMPKSLIVRTELHDNKWNRSRLCERLIFDVDFSISAALLELKYWENYWETKHVKRVWSHTVASYNQGFHCDINSKYVKDIKKKIKYLKRHKILKEL